MVSLWFYSACEEIFVDDSNFFGAQLNWIYKSWNHLSASSVCWEKLLGKWFRKCKFYYRLATIHLLLSCAAHMTAAVLWGRKQINFIRISQSAVLGKNYRWKLLKFKELRRPDHHLNCRQIAINKPVKRQQTCKAVL